MKYNITEQHSFFRRGMVLGFTMAEIVILIIFMLLLIFSTVITLNKNKRANLETENNKLKKVIESKLTSKMLVSPSDFAKLLVKSQDFDSLKESLEERESQLQEYKRSIESAGYSDMSPADLEKELITAKALQEKIDPKKISKDDLKDIISQNRMQKREIAHLNSSNDFYRKKLDALGKGTEMPSCWWSSSERGKVEYIYDIELSSSGITIYDRRLDDEHLDDLKKLPVQTVSRKVTLSQQEFLRQTYPLFQWSKDNQCRFFVQVTDKTNTDEKTKYKTLMRAVEAHFYKLEIDR